MKCAFSGYWEGQCEKEEILGRRFCAYHLEYEAKSCTQCGAPATSYCGVTVMGGAIVCGLPLCIAHKYDMCPNHSQGHVQV